MHNYDWCKNPGRPTQFLPQYLIYKKGIWKWISRISKESVSDGIKAYVFIFFSYSHNKGLVQSQFLPRRFFPISKRIYPISPQYWPIYIYIYNIIFELEIITTKSKNGQYCIIFKSKEWKTKYKASQTKLNKNNSIRIRATDYTNNNVPHELRMIQNLVPVDGSVPHPVIETIWFEDCGYVVSVKIPPVYFTIGSALIVAATGPREYNSLIILWVLPSRSCGS